MKAGFDVFAVALVCAFLFSTDSFAQLYGPVESAYAFRKCLDIPAGERDNKVQVQIYDCNGGDNQQWAFIPVDVQNGWGMIKNLYSGKCLDVRAASMSTGANVQQYTCQGTDNQLWRRGPGNTLVQVKHSGLCIGPSGGNTGNKTWVLTQHCRDVYGVPYTTALWGFAYVY